MAIKLPELVTSTEEEYEALAIENWPLIRLSWREFGNAWRPTD